mmetsp:Transcript_4686/g.9415  ORF Transcript_4686/g.9415 Transcript_4686/m.9415 type:complete len:363 (+) Transcript_4686:14-1102(+)
MSGRRRSSLLNLFKKSSKKGDDKAKDADDGGQSPTQGSDANQGDQREEKIGGQKMSSAPPAPPAPEGPVVPPTPPSDDMRISAGETYSSQSIPISQPPADMFRLRVGPNYRRNGKKEPSGAALYDLVAVDICRSTKGKMEETFDYFKPVLGETGVAGSNIPYSFVVTANLPVEEPSMFSTPGTGPSFVIVFHFTASPTLLEGVKGISSGKGATPAVKLLDAWCRDSAKDSACMGRFKAMCMIDDIEKQGFPSFISKFNGKPVLINKSGTFVRYCEGDGHGTLVKDDGGTSKACKAINMLINVHVFAFIARKGLFSLQQSFKKMRLNVAFTIEGRTDEELPEVVLGCCKLSEIDMDKFRVLDI